MEAQKKNTDEEQYRLFVEESKQMAVDCFSFWINETIQQPFELWERFDIDFDLIYNKAVKNMSKRKNAKSLLDLLTKYRDTMIPIKPENEG